MATDSVHTEHVARLGDLIREERERQQLTQLQLANRVGVSLRTVGNWERGGVIRDVHLPAIESALGARFVRDGRGFRLVSTAKAPIIDGMDAIEVPGGDGDETPLIIFVRRSKVQGMSQEAYDLAIAAARLAFLQKAYELDRQENQGQQ